MKRLFAVIMCITMLFGLATISGAEEQIPVYIDGQRLTVDVAPVMRNDRVLVPMRAIFEAMGAEVAWFEAERVVAAVGGGTEIYMQIDNTMMYINSYPIIIDCAPIIVNGRTMVPIRVCAESFGSLVEWKDRSVYITSPKSDIAYDETKLNVAIETELGTIKIKLRPDVAPATVTNFQKLVSEDFYDGLTFHRIISGFMIQGGDPLGNGTGGSRENIIGEFASNGRDNPLSHKRGVVSMARSMIMNGASSQFFIMHRDTDYLDGNYAAFGEVTEGMEIVDAITQTVIPVDENGTVPLEQQPKIIRIYFID